MALHFGSAHKLGVNSHAAKRVCSGAMPKVAPAVRPNSRVAKLDKLVTHSTPPDVPKENNNGGRAWFETILSRFGPLKEKPEAPATLDFEKPLLELDKRIKEVLVQSSTTFAY